jgi:flavin reductase (DIM6/NTAB) family NADH-FMN oxidoreductase RutF
VTADQFRRLMSHFATGLTVVTATGENGAAYGVTVNSFTSVSLEPLLVLICLDNRLSGFSYFEKGRLFGVSMLAEDQEEVSRYFAQRGLDRSEADYREGITAVPLIRGALATLECLIVEAYPAGDHTIFVGEVKAGDLDAAAEGKGPLLYFRSRYTRLR